jgi:Core-2/I-Branching enzyme
MILSRHFVAELMTNPIAHHLLAFSEHVSIPDELFFATFGMSGQTNVTVREGTPTWFHFSDGHIHPDWVTLDQVKSSGMNAMFVRKVQMNDKDVKRYADERRAASDVQNL